MQTQDLNMAVVPQQWLDSVVSKIESVETLLRVKNDEEIKGQWIESAEARKMIGVCAKTWQTYRDERRIPFSQNGRKIYYKRADLEAFMEEHYISARVNDGRAKL